MVMYIGIVCLMCQVNEAERFTEAWRPKEGADVKGVTPTCRGDQEGLPTGFYLKFRFTFTFSKIIIFNGYL